MTTKEKLLKILKRIFKHLTYLNEIKKDNVKFLKDNKKEIYKLIKEDEEVSQLLISIKELEKGLGI